MDKQLRTYFIDFDETEFESGVDMIAITENPAIETFALKFNSEAPVLFKFDREKGIIAGAALIPDKPILRYDEKKKEYFNVVFTKEVIERMVNKFNSEQRITKFNFNHDGDTPVEGFIKGSWIVEDSEKDKSAFYGFNLPQGTWFIEAQITDRDFWDEVVSKMDRVGFSVEGLMGLIGYKFKELETNKKTENNMKHFNVLTVKNKKTFNKKLRKFEEVEVTEEGILVAEEITEGQEVSLQISEDEAVAAPTGEYHTEDEVIYVEDGVIVAIMDSEKEEEAAEEFATEEDEDKEEYQEDAPTEDEVEEVVEEAIEEAQEDTMEEKLAGVVALIAELSGRIDELEAKLSEAGQEDFSKEKFNEVVKPINRLSVVRSVIG
jgi:hypothetical protein